MSKQIIVSELPSCDICNNLAQYDTRTIYGSWANLYQSCYDKIGEGQLGTGHGQKLVLHGGNNAKIP